MDDKKLMEELQPVIDQVKSNGQSVFKTKIAGRVYIYRSINRSEYRRIQDMLMKQAKAFAASMKDRNEEDIGSVSDKARDDGEEELFKVACLYPKVEKVDLNSLPAGVVSKIAELVMEASGFSSDAAEVEQL